MSEPQYWNKPAANTPYFTPEQDPPSGTALDPQPDGKPTPKLFQPLTIRGVTFQNRVWLSPLCQYSTKDGVVKAWHMAHLGGISSRGPGLTMTEATSVLPEGRISPECPGLWNDEQAAAWKEIVTFVHSQGQKIGTQLAHAGRKASMVAPWLSFSQMATEERDGWPDAVVGPSAIAHGPGYPEPKELTAEGIAAVRQAFVDAARRAVAVGFDIIEIHSAHGYLLHEFLSPVSNKRTDAYGGSFENRTRLHVEIVDAVRAVIPESLPLFMRISGSDLLENTLPDEPSWRVEDSARLASLVAEHGVDLIDVSAGGAHPLQELRLRQEGANPAYQAYLSEHIKAATKGKVLVSTVGGIRNGNVAQAVLENNQADTVFVGRYFQKQPGVVWQFADDLGVSIFNAHQIEWGFLGRGLQNRRKTHL